MRPKGKIQKAAAAGQKIGAAAVAPVAAESADSFYVNGVLAPKWRNVCVKVKRIALPQQPNSEKVKRIALPQQPNSEKANTDGGMAKKKGGATMTDNSHNVKGPGLNSRLTSTVSQVINHNIRSTRSTIDLTFSNDVQKPNTSRVSKGLVVGGPTLSRSRMAKEIIDDGEKPSTSRAAKGVLKRITTPQTDGNMPTDNGNTRRIPPPAPPTLRGNLTNLSTEKVALMEKFFGDLRAEEVASDEELAGRSDSAPVTISSSDEEECSVPKSSHKKQKAEAPKLRKRLPRAAKDK